MVKEKIIEFKSVIITLVIGLILIGVTKFVGSTFDSRLEDIKNQLSSVNNQISSINMMSAKEVVVVKPFEGGFSPVQKAKDDEIIYNYILDAFTFSDSYEYNEHRAKYVELLGETNQFVIDILPPYEAVYGEMGWETQGPVDDGTRISSSMKTLHSFVSNIQYDGSYQYFTIVTRNYVSSSGHSEQSNVYLTYTIDSDGNVIDFTSAIQQSK